ncbi:MAG: peptidoglycan editing factor PgeF [Lysobacter sp.]
MPAEWPAPRPVRAFTTLRHGAGGSKAPFDTFNLGNRVAVDGDDPDRVECNRAELIGLAGLPYAPHWLRQVHGTRVVRVDGPIAVPAAALPRGVANPAGAATREAKTIEPEADAAVTSTAGVVLAILTADCLPVLFCAAAGGEVAAAHAGWRGLAGGVLEATVAAMRTPAAQVMAWLGPAAGPQNYEIGVEVRQALLTHDPAAARAFTATRPGHWRVDLYALARQRLAAAGIAAASIHGGGLCTIADPQRFYSHRRDQRTGRMASLIWTNSSGR